MTEITNSDIIGEWEIAQIDYNYEYIDEIPLTDAFEDKTILNQGPIIFNSDGTGYTSDGFYGDMSFQWTLSDSSITIEPSTWPYTNYIFDFIILNYSDTEISLSLDYGVISHYVLGEEYFYSLVQYHTFSR